MYRTLLVGFLNPLLRRLSRGLAERHTYSIGGVWGGNKAAALENSSSLFTIQRRSCNRSTANCGMFSSITSRSNRENEFHPTLLRHTSSILHGAPSSPKLWAALGLDPSITEAWPGNRCVSGASIPSSRDVVPILVDEVAAPPASWQLRAHDAFDKSPPSLFTPNIERIIKNAMTCMQGRPSEV